VNGLLQLYNTLTGTLEVFKPIDDMQVKMYTCGPSTYQPAHIGNYRTFLFEDTLQRYLEYLGFNVKRLITLTDVEDKAIAQAKKENLSVEELTKRNENTFFREFELLRIKKPDLPVRASSTVDQAVNLISQLIQKGYAYPYIYQTAKNVYFEPLKFSGFGKLAHLNMSKWPKKKRRFHKDTYPGTPWNMGDFIVWHGCKEGDVCWKTSLGTGRPAWNIQDAAIVTKNFGFTIDIACGGADNLVRHHDYTIAIAESISGKTFSKYWLHGAHLLVEGKKMSKSTGNVYYLKDLLQRGFTGAQIRFFLIYGCYKDTLDFTFEKIVEAARKLQDFKAMITALSNADAAISDKAVHELMKAILADFEESMNLNLNVKEAFDKINEKVEKNFKLKNQVSAKDAGELMANLRRIDSVLQCIF
jgi:cysteinyl-tRNA synthetase